MNIISIWKAEPNHLQEAIDSAKELSSSIQNKTDEAFHVYNKTRIESCTEEKETSYSCMSALASYIPGAVGFIMGLSNEREYTKVEFLTAGMLGLAVTYISEKIFRGLNIDTETWVLGDFKHTYSLNKDIRLIDERSRTIEENDPQKKGLNELKKVISVQRGILSGMRNSRLIKAMLKTGITIAVGCFFYTDLTHNVEGRRNALFGLCTQLGALTLVELKDRFFPWTNQGLQDAIDEYETVSGSWF